MLIRLYLKDFAVVREAEAGFGPGMTVVSGETGAGKSLLVDALGLLTGGRADSTMVRHGAERAELAAEFDLGDAEAARQWLREQELDEDNQCQLRRVLRADGGSRAWINGRPASAGQLAELAPLLVEIHGQHEHQALLSRGHQLNLLDAFGGHQAQVEAVRRLASDWLLISRELDALTGRDDPSGHLEYLRHQLDELEREALSPDDIETLIANHRRQSHAASLLQGCETALARLSAEDGFGLGQGLRQVDHELARQIEHEPRLAEVRELIDSAGIQIDEAAASLERIRDDLDLDPERMQQLESRLSRLHDLARKHRIGLPELSERRDRLAAEVESLRGADEKAGALVQRRNTLEADWLKAARALGHARIEAAGRLGASVTGLLSQLGMAGGRFEVQLEAQDSSPNGQGLERVEFLVSANPGQPPRPLRKVASGGELSRISLAIEVAALGLDEVPSMVFDEVDSGIGGAVAEVVGRKLRELGGRRQVLCVTHLPQVAAQGHAHLRVNKDNSGQDSRSVVSTLDQAGRIDELARMLGGVEIGRETLEHARQMLSRAQGG